MSAIATAIIGSALVGGVTSLIGSSEQSSAANNAANQQANTAQSSEQLQYQMYEQGLNQPINQAMQAQGPGAINQLAGGYTMQQFQNSPAYQSMLGANTQLLQQAPAQYAASGMLGSGNMQSGLQQQAQLNALNAENTAYNQWAGPLQTVAGLGQATMAGNQQAGLSTGQSMGNTATNSAAYQGYYNMLGANALAGGANQVGSLAMQGINNYMGYNNFQNYLNSQNNSLDTLYGSGNNYGIGTNYGIGAGYNWSTNAASDSNY